MIKELLLSVDNKLVCTVDYFVIDQTIFIVQDDKIIETAKSPLWELVDNLNDLSYALNIPHIILEGDKEYLSDIVENLYKTTQFSNNELKVEVF
jgi:hypothetical protein